MCWNTVSEVLSQKDANQNGVAEPFLLALVYLTPPLSDGILVTVCSGTILKRKIVRIQGVLE
jgi:hypothetical protein